MRLIVVLISTQYIYNLHIFIYCFMEKHNRMLEHIACVREIKSEEKIYETLKHWEKFLLLISFLCVNIFFKPWKYAKLTAELQKIKLLFFVSQLVYQLIPIIIFSRSLFLSSHFLISVTSVGGNSSSFIDASILYYILRWDYCVKWDPCG